MIQKQIFSSTLWYLWKSSHISQSFMNTVSRRIPSSCMVQLCEVRRVWNIRNSSFKLVHAAVSEYEKMMLP